MHPRYFWPSIFKDYVKEVKKGHPCQTYTRKMCSHPTPLHPVISIGPFMKWGIDFTTCHPTSSSGHKYIIVVVDYFTKWVEAMPTFTNEDKTVAIFMFNHIIARFRVLKEIVTDLGSHFQNCMMTKLSTSLGFKQEHWSLYYPQANEQVEAVNKTLKHML